MEQANELNFLSGLFIFAGVIFIIALGVIMLNQNFQKNLYLQMLKNEELKNIYLQDLLTTLLAAQDEEKKRIAADLRNELGVNKIELQNTRSISEVEANLGSTLAKANTIPQAKP
jgi:signal transduction histidine kinase